MRLDEFDYSLPKELVAQRPLDERDSSRMMVLKRSEQTIGDRAFRDLPEILVPGDLLVVNNTRVFPARLLGRRRGVRSQRLGKNNPGSPEFLTAEVELLLASNEGGDIWQGLVHPGRRVRTGELLVFGDEDLEAEVLGRGEHGWRRVRLQARKGSVQDAIDRLGHVPLPPYVDRPDEPADRDAYQTVYAKVRGAVAAPTAGFHFTNRVLEALNRRGVEVAEITLHVGPGTFRPVQVQNVEEHEMTPEPFEISETASQSINKAIDDGRRVIAVGTTSVRTLEYAAAKHDGKIVPMHGETDLFIYPGFKFKVTRALVTNFHLPKSTLMMLVCAFADRDFTLRAYEQAIAERYRFYSYGDCMLVL